MNNRGQINELASNFRVVIAIFMVLIIIGVFAFGFVLLSATFLNGFGTITQTLENIPSTSNATNISNAAKITFGNYNTAFQQLKWMSFVLIFSMILGTTIAAMTIRINQGWFPVYIVFVLIAIVFSIYISNSYETILDGGTGLSTSLATFSEASWLIINLPFLIGIVGTVGVVFIFIKSMGGDSL